jgi:hypothetical protein
MKRPSSIPLDRLAARLLLAWLAAVLPLASVAQDSPAAVPAPASQASTSNTDDSEEAEEDAPAEATGNPTGSTNAPAVSTNGPAGTNGPSRRSTRRSSRRTPERSGMSNWRPSSRSSSSSKGPSTNGPAMTDYAYFQVVNDRNIFNPSRVPNRPDRPRSTEERRQPKVESISLVGTLRYDKGVLAFFDGSSPDFKKALKQGDSISTHRILSVTDTTVRLVVKDAPIDLKVGSQLRREDEGPWSLAQGTTTSGSSASTSSTSSSSPSASSTESSSSSSPSNDILKRLMERRAKENSK